MSSRGIIDLRGKKPSGGLRLPLSSSPKKRVPLRSRRRRTRVLIAAAFVVCVALCGYGASWLTYLPSLSIQDVKVTGAETLPAELVEKYVESKVYDGSRQLISSANIFFYPKHEIELGLPDFFPRIKSASLSREALLAQSVIVTIEERTGYAKWCMGASLDCYVIDKEGYIFADATSTPTVSPYIFRGEIGSAPIGGRYLPAHIAGVSALLDKLGQAGFIGREVNAVSSQDLLITLDSGLVLKASFGANADALVRNLQLVLSSEALKSKASELEYIDLRFGNRVYYKLKGEAQQQTSE